MAGSVKPCERCGKHYHRVKGLGDVQWAGRRFCSKTCAGRRNRVPNVEMAALYRSGHSSTEIAELFGISHQSVLYSLRADGVPIRSARDSHMLRLAKTPRRPCPEHVKDILRAKTGPANAHWRSGLTISGGYLQFTASPANGVHSGKLLHKVIAEWKLGRSLTEAEVVHHDDENKLNNHPENLLVMTQAEHAALHAKTNKFWKGRHNGITKSR